MQVRSFSFGVGEVTMTVGISKEGLRASPSRRSYPMPRPEIVARLREGVVIPAHPLALTRSRKLDERRQRALTRYYVAAGAGGVAIGVHTTQFEIHDPDVGLFQPVLELCAETLDEQAGGDAWPAVRVAGICGRTQQAVREAQIAADFGYHSGLLSLTAFHDAPLSSLISHARAVAEVIPLFGFYLQPSVGGRILPLAFWRRFVEIENVIAIKIAPFNRYQTLDVLRATVEAGRGGEIALYTGNDDNIIGDLLTRFRFSRDSEQSSLQIVGGLLGHWAVWTRTAVSHLQQCHRYLRSSDGRVPGEMLTLAAQVTDSNAAFFDTANRFAGGIAGIHEVLRRQGLLEGRWCLNPKETVSPGQLAEIERVYAAYPHLNDDAFVAKHLDSWLN